MTERYVHALWCDDIRQEVGNKPSFMGVYTGGILVPSLPTILPRLAVYIWIKTPIGQPFESLRIRISRDDEFLLIETPLEKLPDQSAVTPQPNRTQQVVMTGILISGVEMPADCKYFRVLVETESETLEGPKLHINVDKQRFADASCGFIESATPDAESPNSGSRQD